MIPQDKPYHVILTFEGLGQNGSIGAYVDTAEDLRQVFRQFMAGMGFMPGTIDEVVGEAG